MFGTYLKRIATRFQQDVVQIYASQGIRFDLSWFPIFYLLKKKEQYSVTELAKAVDISHPALNQILKALEKEGLIAVERDPKDLRKKMLSLNKKGLALSNKVQPVWRGIQRYMRELFASVDGGGQLFSILNELENRLSGKSLYTAVTSELPHQTSPIENEKI